MLLHRETTAPPFLRATSAAAPWSSIPQDQLMNAGIRMKRPGGGKKKGSHLSLASLSWSRSTSPGSLSLSINAHFQLALQSAQQTSERRGHTHRCMDDTSNSSLLQQPACEHLVCRVLHPGGVYYLYFLVFYILSELASGAYQVGRRSPSQGFPCFLELLTAHLGANTPFMCKVCDSKPSPANSLIWL